MPDAKIAATILKKIHDETLLATNMLRSVTVNCAYVGTALSVLDSR